MNNIITLIETNLLSFILIIIIILLLIIIFNLSRNYLYQSKQNDILKESINNIRNIINIASDKLNKVDKKGIFNNDDETGFIFNQIKNIQTILKKIIVINEQSDSKDNSK